MFCLHSGLKTVVVQPFLDFPRRCLTLILLKCGSKWLKNNVNRSHLGIISFEIHMKYTSNNITVSILQTHLVL